MEIIKAEGFKLNQDDCLRKLREAIINCDENESKKHATALAKTHLNPLEIVEKHLAPAMKIVGDRFEQGQYFLTHLMMAGEIMKEVVGILTENMSEKNKNELDEKRSKTGKIVIGTVKGDIHDIGKNIVATLLSVNGFNVYDVGKDVGPRDLIKKADDVKADVIALSALLTVTRWSQAEVIKLLNEQGMRKRYKVVVGGGPTTEEWAKEIGADGWAPDATGAVDLVKKLLQSMQNMNSS